MTMPTADTGEQRPGCAANDGTVKVGDVIHVTFTAATSVYAIRAAPDERGRWFVHNLLKPKGRKGLWIAESG